MRICIDLDGTICDLKQPHESYADVKPKAGAKEMIQKLREEGHTIIIHTARNMATCDHNVGKVLKNVGKITLDWLERHGILYDEIFLASPMRILPLMIESCVFKTTGTPSPPNT